MWCIVVTAEPNFNIELHCHTVYSKDGLITFESLAGVAEMIGLNAIAITDHDTTEGAKEFQRWAKAKGLGLQVIIGEERTLADGIHFIGLFLQEPITSSSLADVVLEIEQQGGLCLAPHPFRKKDGVFRDGMDFLPLLQEHQVAFELFNAKSSATDNKQARLFLDSVNPPNGSSALRPFVGSDAHYESDLGESLNIIHWQGDLRTSLEKMLRGPAPCRLLGKAQQTAEPERAYAPMYYKIKPLLRVPRPFVPLAKQCYRWYRNRSRGVGAKKLVEMYARS
jgi:hypothetical protein